MSKEAENLHKTLTSLRTRAESAEGRVAELERHYTAAGPEHNLLALLDLYHERAESAEARVKDLEALIQRTHGCHVGWVAEADRQGSIASGYRAEMESRGRRIAELESEVARLREEAGLEAKVKDFASEHGVDVVLTLHYPGANWRSDITDDGENGGYGSLKAETLPVLLRAILEVEKGGSGG